MSLSKNEDSVCLALSGSSQETKNLKLLRIGGLCGILGSALPLMMVLAATVLSPWFSWDANALSELGVGEESMLFNSAVLLGGVLNFLFTIGLIHYFNREKQAKIGAASVMLSSVFLALVGIFTINYHIMHGVAALGYFVLAPVGFIIIGHATKDSTVKKLSIACGITALISILILPMIIFVTPFNIGFAVPELIEALIISVWVIFMSTKLLRR